tara:strand:- start:551 stop:1141 length:591 start_codon:yes stop_codon:yes gene_type:complete
MTGINLLSNKMKNNIIIPILVLLSIIIGGYTAISNINASTQNNEFSIKNGNWKVNPNMDLKDSYQRAYISRIGVFALDDKEALYFLSSKDSDGNPLTSDFDYQIIGTPPKGRYWSYTLYGEDYFLVKNDANIYTINKENLTKDKPILLSSSKKDINWLPSGNETKFHITLRVYNPDESVYKNLESLELPIIKKIEK